MSGEAIIKDVNRWWPYLMHPEPAYLYTIEVRLSTKDEENADVYRMKFGVRTLKVNVRHETSGQMLNFEFIFVSSGTTQHS